MERPNPLRWAADAATKVPWRRLGLGAIASAVIAVAAFWVAAHLIPLPERLDDADSTVVLYEDGQPAHVLLSDDDRWRFPTELEDVDPAYVDALIALEDKRFESHPGVDPIAIGRAAFDNLRAGSTVSGASTITMQLVRLLEPRPRTLRSKAVEAFRAMQLEVHMTKEEILAAYLRFAPFGGNIEGIEAATLSYWGRTPTGLSSAEIATLLAIPQSPQARAPDHENAQRLRDARDDIATELADADAIPKSNRPDELAEELDNTEVPTRAKTPPRDIPQLVHWIKHHHPDAFEQAETARGEPSVRIETTLEEPVQRRISQIAEDRAHQLRLTGAPHAAVVVLESETGRVRGVVGNLGYDRSIAGSHVPAFAAPRSTGSLLKPVAYAAALDEGLVAPSHALLDVPIVRGDYRPLNFDRKFRGLVEAEKSLALSLNIPFVRLIEDLSVGEFVQTMVRFGQLGPVRRAGDGGLELVVGGMPASPLEVASLYAGFARAGTPVTPEFFDVDAPTSTPVADDRKPNPYPKWLSRTDIAPRPPSDGSDSDFSHRAVTPAAAWLTTRALTRRPTPWSEVGPRRTRDEGFAWKTGTSFSYHDAWTAGFGAEYTVAVWAGDLDFVRHPELIGANVAAPLFFELMEVLDDPIALRQTKPTEALAEIEVCSRSGRRPGPHCQHTTTTKAPATTAAPQRCELHVEVDVDAETGKRLPSGCRPDGVDEVTPRIVEQLPEVAARFQSARGRRAGTLPDIHPDCRAEEGATLAITFPSHDTTVTLESDRPADRQPVRLEAYSSTGALVHWYVDGRHIESAPSDEAVYWTPEPGQFTISAVDERGTRHSRELTVQGQAAPPDDSD